MSAGVRSVQITEVISRIGLPMFLIANGSNSLKKMCSGRLSCGTFNDAMGKSRCFASNVEAEFNPWLVSQQRIQ